MSGRATQLRSQRPATTAAGLPRRRRDRLGTPHRSDHEVLASGVGEHWLLAIVGELAHQIGDVGRELLRLHRQVFLLLVALAALAIVLMMIKSASAAELNQGDRSRQIV